MLDSAQRYLHKVKNYGYMIHQLIPGAEKQIFPVMRGNLLQPLSSVIRDLLDLAIMK